MKLIDLFKLENVSKKVSFCGLVYYIYYTKKDKFYLVEKQLHAKPWTNFNFYAWTSDDWELIEEPLPEVKPCWGCGNATLIRIDSCPKATIIMCYHRPCKNFVRIHVMATLTKNHKRAAIKMWNAVQEIGKNA